MAETLLNLVRTLGHLTDQDLRAKLAVKSSVVANICDGCPTSHRTVKAGAIMDVCDCHPDGTDPNTGSNKNIGPCISHCVRLAHDELCRLMSDNKMLTEKVNLLEAEQRHFNDCHVWEPDENLDTIADSVEIIITADALRHLINTNGVKLPCPIGSDVFCVQKELCDKRDKDRCTECCDGWNNDCPDNQALLGIVQSKFSYGMIPMYGITVFSTPTEAAMAMAKILVREGNSSHD